MFYAQKCVGIVSAARADIIPGFHGRASSAGDSSAYVSDENESDEEASAYYAQSTKDADTSVKILDEDVEDSADCASSVHVSEEDVVVEFELAETLPVKDCSSDFNVNISDDEDSTAVECANQNMRAISKL